MKKTMITRYVTDEDTSKSLIELLNIYYGYIEESGGPLSLNIWGR
jgi:hypothetical protein